MTEDLVLPEGDLSVQGSGRLATTFGRVDMDGGALVEALLPLLALRMKAKSAELVRILPYQLTTQLGRPTLDFHQRPTLFRSEDRYMADFVMYVRAIEPFENREANLPKTWAARVRVEMGRNTGLREVDIDFVREMRDPEYTAGGEMFW